jgi:hypothetical protein
MKLVFIMRDPVERAWSAVNNAMKKGSIEVSPTLEMIIERARSPGTASRSAYVDTIERIETVFPRDQIHYCFFDDLLSRPTRLVADLFSFLGVRPETTAFVQLPSAVNVAAGLKPIPTEFSITMARDYLPSVQELCQRFDGPPETWRGRYERLLNGRDGRPRSLARSSLLEVGAWRRFSGTGIRQGYEQGNTPRPRLSCYRGATRGDHLATSCSQATSRIVAASSKRTKVF